jgi:KDO2-lipid IV(A) lauroyltransferase
MKIRRPWLDYLVYLMARSVALFLGLFPVNANLRTARMIGGALWAVDRKHQKRAYENLRASFPDWTDDQIKATAKRSFQHFLELVIDVLFSTRLVHVYNWHQYVKLGALSDPLRWQLQQRGCIMLTGHYGNWEILGYTLATLGFESYAVARPIDNPYINEWILGVRQKRGQTILSKRGVTESAQDVLAQRGVLGFIADQNAGPKGMFVPFFGRQASTYKSIALLAIEHKVPVIIGCARRIDGKFEFEIEVSDIITPEEWQHEANEVRYITARYTAAIEKFVRHDQTQYLWIHRRWKSRPRDEVPGSVAGVG